MELTLLVRNAHSRAGPAQGRSLQRSHSRGSGRTPAATARAAKGLEEIVAREPELAEARYQLGRAYARLQRNKEAEEQMAVFQRLTNRTARAGHKRARRFGEEVEAVRF